MGTTKSYEVTVLFSPDLASDALKKAQDAVAQAVASFGGKIEKTNEWGRKFLSYKMQKHDEAFFVLYNVSLPAENQQKLSRAIRLISGVLRELCVVAMEEENA